MTDCTSCKNYIKLPPDERVPTWIHRGCKTITMFNWYTNLTPLGTDATKCKDYEGN